MSDISDLKLIRLNRDIGDKYLSTLPGSRLINATIQKVEPTMACQEGTTVARQSECRRE
jgi:hypothetical protein